MTENDPTDHALAAIAQILDKPETPPSLPHTAAAEAVAEPEIQLAEEILAAPPSAPSFPVASADVETDFDDTESAPTAIDDTGDGTYTKYGPGPLAAIRFKWTTRRDNTGDYFVHETIGENSHPLISGPMTREAAIKFVDDHEHQARQRFEALRSEMAGGEIGRHRDGNS